jgi:flagellar biosynthesis protein FlhG
VGVFELDDRPAAKIWAFGGGKGGAGKSVIAANLGTALAQGGAKVALVDLDLGGANLHTLFGMGNPRRTLSDFISRRVPAIEDTLLPTPIEGQWLISGARALLDAANLKHAQKLRLLRQLSGLEVDHVILDLGAGSTFNTIDFYLAAHQGILVVVPEPTSVENAYHFLKAAFYRRLRSAEPTKRVRSVLEIVVNERDQRGIKSPRDLIARAAEVDPEVGAILETVTESFRPGVLVNRAETDRDRRLGEEIGVAAQHYFGTPFLGLGALDKDLLVTRAVREKKPVVVAYPGGPFSQGVRQLAERLADLRAELR